MQIYLIRHTRVGVQHDLFYGHTDVPLADTFEKEAKEVAIKLKGIVPDAVFSSPMKRCTMLAEKIVRKAAIRIDKRLMEINFGSWELRSWNEIKGISAENWYRNFVEEKCPGGESYIQLFKRAGGFFDELKKQKYSTVFIFTHSGFIRASYSYFDKVELKDTFKINIGYGYVCRFEL